MRISHLRVENFRCIRELDLVLDETTVLIGANNTGKTAILVRRESSSLVPAHRVSCVFVGLLPTSPSRHPVWYGLVSGSSLATR